MFVIPESERPKLDKIKKEMAEHSDEIFEEEKKLTDSLRKQGFNITIIDSDGNTLY
jgi:hypothetical protein